jgi:hypothetical protein
VGVENLEKPLSINYGTEHEKIDRARCTIPIANRGQAIKFSYLNSTKNPHTPNVWLTVTQKGVRLKFRIPQNQILGVPQPRAAFVGVLIGVITVIVLVWKIVDPWVVAVSAMTYGLIAQLPGAFAIRLLRKAKKVIGG